MLEILLKLFQNKRTKVVGFKNCLMNQEQSVSLF